jgi:hypothetical protein
MVELKLGPPKKQEHRDSLRIELQHRVKQHAAAA